MQTSLPTCRCGHDRYHHAVRREMTYGLGAWVLLFQGSSARPRRIVFRCSRCAAAFDEERDPQTLEAFRRA